MNIHGIKEFNGNDKRGFTALKLFLQTAQKQYRKSVQYIQTGEKDAIQESKNASSSSIEPLKKKRKILKKKDAQNGSDNEGNN